MYGVDDYSFPPGFKFGVASAAYQVEGAWNVSGRFWYSNYVVEDVMLFTTTVK